MELRAVGASLGLCWRKSKKVEKKRNQIQRGVSRNFHVNRFFSNLNQFHMFSLIWFGRQLRILPLNAYNDALRQGVDFVIFYSLLKL